MPSGKYDFPTKSARRPCTRINIIFIITRWYIRLFVVHLRVYTQSFRVQKKPFTYWNIASKGITAPVEFLKWLYVIAREKIIASHERPCPVVDFVEDEKKIIQYLTARTTGPRINIILSPFFFVFLFCHLSSQPSTIYTPRVRHGFLTYNICFLGRANPFSGRRKKTISLSLRRVRPSEIKRAGARASDSVVPNYYSGRAERGGGGCWKCNINTTYIRTYTGRLQSEKYRIRKLSGRSIMRACVYVHAKRGVPKRTNA